jgi:hypothetical protein
MKHKCRFVDLNKRQCIMQNDTDYWNRHDICGRLAADKAFGKMIYSRTSRKQAFVGMI